MRWYGYRLILLYLLLVGAEAFQTLSCKRLHHHSSKHYVRDLNTRHRKHIQSIHVIKDKLDFTENQSSKISGFLSGNLSIWQARALLGIIACSYGTNTIAIKVLENNLEPSLIVLLRFAVATIIFIPFMRQDMLHASGNFVKNGMYIGFVNAVGFLAQSAALLSAAASNTAFIASLSVVVVPLIEVLTPGGRKSSNFVKFYPAFVAIAGIACLELGGDNSAPSIGTALALVQPIVWGWSYVLLEKVLKDCAEPEDSLALTGGMVFAVVLVALAWSFSQVLLPNLDAGTLDLELNRIVTLLQEPLVIGSLLWTGVFTTGLASLGECVALKSLTASEATIIFASEPIWASVYASSILGEEFGLNSYIGGALVIVATLWSQKISDENNKQ